jgi:hypothetical protein
MKQRRRKNPMPPLDTNLNLILEHYHKGEQVMFEKQDKTMRGLHNGTSDRRSKYIGVLKYKSFWQALINVGKLKRYIGTFDTENEAALAHDFYSIGLHYIEAKTNFSYQVVDLVPLINDYYKCDRQLNPSNHT